jgi:hypothetical protein
VEPTFVHAVPAECRIDNLDAKVAVDERNACMPLHALYVPMKQR